MFAIRLLRMESNSPWGFRLAGGREYGQPLSIMRVTPGSLAERGGLQTNDRVLRIGNKDAQVLTHQEAQQAVVNCRNELDLDVIREDNKPMAAQPQLTEDKWGPPMLAGGSGFTSPPPHQRLESGSSFDSSSNFSTPRQSTVTAPKPCYAQEEMPMPKLSQENPAPMPKRAPPPKNVRGSGRRGQTVQRQSVSSAGQPPLCGGCGVLIRGPFLLALDKAFCPNHFLCSVCNRGLEDCGFVEEDGKLYCEADYARLLAPNCARCGQVALGQIVKALDRTWHPHCFLCTHCRAPLQGQDFHVEDGAPYCQSDWQELFKTKCTGCKFPIEPCDRFIDALGGQFHAECFVCATCQCGLEGKPFQTRDNKAYCKKHTRAF